MAIHRKDRELFLAQISFDGDRVERSLLLYIVMQAF